MIFFKSIVIWLMLIILESLHGTLRQLLLAPYIGDFRARQISVFTGSILILLTVSIFIKWLPHLRISQLLAIGLLWVSLTVGFEIALGRFVLDYSWTRILSDYNLLEGGLMPIGLFVLMLSPLIAVKVRGVFTQYQRV
jgi:hypothetical protein